MSDVEISLNSVQQSQNITPVDCEHSHQHNAELSCKVPQFLVPNSKVTLNSSASTVLENKTVDLNLPLDPKTFPQQSHDGGRGVLATIPNLEHMLSSYGIIVQYDVITNKAVIQLKILSFVDMRFNWKIS